jgi:hypothetical protein
LGEAAVNVLRQQLDGWGLLTQAQKVQARPR